MMRKNRVSSLMWGAAFAMLVLNACTNEAAQPLPENHPDGDIKNVVFIAAGFDEDNAVQSRVDYTIAPDENGVNKPFFAWALGDTIGILPAGAAQVYFKIAEIDEADPAKAKFTGVAWGLKSGVDYAAYYPFIQDIMLDRTKVPVDYSVQRYSPADNAEGQLVVSPSHNYQAAKPVPRADGGLNFEFKHLGGLVEVQFTLPEGQSGAVKQLHLIADEPVFPVKGTFNLEAETVAITPDEAELASSVTVNVSDLTAEAGIPTSVFFMMPPMAHVDINKLSVGVVYGEKNKSLPLVVTGFTNRQGEAQTGLQAATYYTMTTGAMEVPEALNVADCLTLSQYINEVLGTLGGTKLRFITGSPMVSETEVYTDNTGTKAYAVRNGDWLEVHTLARSIKLPESVGNMFDAEIYRNYAKLTSLDLSGFDTSDVTYMNKMFYRCSGLTSLTFGESFDTSGVTDMGFMFFDCSSLASLDLSGFDTSDVTNMYVMFSSCSSLTSLDLSGFKTSKVANMCSMFDGCNSLTSLDLSGFNTSGVTNMSSMFYGCYGLTSLTFGESFDTSDVTDMSYMFMDCVSLTSLDLTSFTFTEGVDVYDIFYDIARDVTESPIAIYVTSDGKTYLENQSTGINENYAKLVVSTEISE